MSAHDLSSPHRWIFLPRNGCNIAPGTDLAGLGSRNRGFSKLWPEILRRGLLLSLDNSSLCEAGTAPESRPFFKPYMDMNRKPTDKTDKKPRTPSYKYSFRLNEEQHIRFDELLCKAGLEHNRSRFIVKRIFAEEFVVVRRDLSKVQFVTRLNDFHFQFHKLCKF